MPQNEEEILKEKHAFYERARLPKIIGSIDCTHVKIQSPGGAHAELYRNRKGYFSINVQTVASTSLKILDIVARWPGSVHDKLYLTIQQLNEDYITMNLVIVF
nr:unnamed protein product [Callosobruchus chinensis]